MDEDIEQYLRAIECAIADDAGGARGELGMPSVVLLEIAQLILDGSVIAHHTYCDSDPGIHRDPKVDK